jgi:hypothetical protein
MLSKKLCALGGSFLGLALALGGCEGKQRGLGTSTSTGSGSLRPFQGNGGGAGAISNDPDGAELSPAARALGAACGSAADCDAPGFCVDGVCCSTPCTELCAACNLPGQLGSCSAAPSDGACAPLACAAQSTDCRQVDASQLALNCESFGKCRAESSCAGVPEAAGVPCAEGAGTCDGNGACSVAGKALLGAACTADADCSEGHCVAGANGASICCDTACEGVCQACSASGHCEASPGVDARCPAVVCPADNVCLDYPAALEAGVCRGPGQCRTVQDCVGTQLLPAAQCTCDTSGACKLLPGATCTSAGQCGSGLCSATALGAQVCCSSSCGAGLFCSGDGARCVACEGANVDCQGNTELRCNGGVVAPTACPNGCTAGVGCNSLPPVGFPCPGGQCATNAVCQTDVDGNQRCCSRDCAADGKVCAQNGSCVCAPGQTMAGNACLLQAGDPCSTGTQCAAGLFCTDGVCCQEACNGACERCEPSTGACVAVARGQQDAQCSGSQQCTGTRGDCRAQLRQECSGDTADAECVSGNCEPVVGNAGAICCALDCSGALPFCKNDGSACVQCETNADCGNGCNTTTGQCNALLDIGRNCGSSAQCANGGACLLDQGGQTRCCERNCAANGQVCNASGRCVLPTVGAGQQCVTGSVNCSGNLQCINNTCQLPTVGQGQACGAAAVCNGSLGLQCLSGVCNCANTQRFAQGRCRLADGQDCTQATDCASGLCTEWLVDVDGDGFGSRESVGGFPSRSICGAGTDANRPPDFIAVRLCLGSDIPLKYQPGGTGREDCCDSSGVPCSQLGVVPSSEAFPGRTIAGQFGQLGSSPADCGSQNNIAFKQTLDFNCDGVLQVVAEPQPVSTLPCAAEPANVSAAVCTARTGFPSVSCGELSTGRVCALSASGLCTQVNAVGPMAPSCL